MEAGDVGRPLSGLERGAGESDTASPRAVSGSRPVANEESLPIARPTGQVTIEDRCLDAFTVALNQASDVEAWYASTKNLHLASLPFCAACRSVATLHLKVDADTPEQLVAAPPLDDEEERVPRLRARRVTWMLPTAEMLSKPIYALADVRVWAFGVFFNDSLEDMVWPGRLSRLVLGDRHSNGPRAAKEFRKSFNMPIAGVEWPTSLQSIVFGDRFTHPVDKAKWPPSLKQVTFGVFFNEPIADVAWPGSIEEMTFGSWFNQPVGGVSWPSCLKKLVWGDSFNQPIDGVVWPALLEVEFGHQFSQSINEVVWPSLHKVTFEHFAYYLENVNVARLLEDNRLWAWLRPMFGQRQMAAVSGGGHIRSSLLPADQLCGLALISPQAGFGSRVQLSSVRDRGLDPILS